MEFENKLNTKLKKCSNAKQVLRYINKNAPDETISQLAKILINKIPNDIQVSVVELEEDILGCYEPNPPTKIKINNKGEYITATFLHETIHAATTLAIESGEPEINEYLKRLNDIKQHAREHLKKIGINPDRHYALRPDSHIEELVAEIFVDPDLVQTLKYVPVKATKGNKIEKYIHSVYNQITEIINEIIKGDIKTYPLVNEIMDITGGIMLVNERLLLAENVQSKKQNQTYRER